MDNQPFVFDFNATTSTPITHDVARWSEYKAKGAPEQERRRNAFLDKQKAKRRDLTEQVRQIASLNSEGKISREYIELLKKRLYWRSIEVDIDIQYNLVSNLDSYDNCDRNE
jgi:hypothetical protein